MTCAVKDGELDVSVVWCGRKLVILWCRLIYSDLYSYSSIHRF